jgi:trk system potassium uptake protein TrkA
MRAVFLGGGALSVMTDRVLLNRAHEVIIIEQAKDRIDVLSDEFACGFIRSVGSKPAILRETDPRDIDFLFCLASNDQINIVASLGRPLAGLQPGYHR